MGESFMGLPNRFNIIDHLDDMKYNPHHALSARMGYTLNRKFENYLPLTGGRLSGDIISKNISPIADSHYSIGERDFRYNAMYARTFYGDLDGNAGSATKIQNKHVLKLTGSMVGSTEFDCSGDITIDCTTNHNHNDLYLSLTGGTLTGNLKLGKNAAIVGYNDRILLSLDSDSVLEIHSGAYNNKKGNITLYSSGDFNLKTNSSGMILTSSLFNKTANFGISKDSIYLSNTKSHVYLHITDDGTLKLDDHMVYHEGNFNPDDYILTAYKSHVNDVKKVIKVLAILLDKLEVSMGVKDSRDYPESDITDELEYFKRNAMEILSE